MCSDSEQPFEGTEPRLIFSSYHFRNKKNKCCRAERAGSRRWELKLTSLFSCFLFSSQGRLHSRVNPHELFLPPPSPEPWPPFCSWHCVSKHQMVEKNREGRKSSGIIVDFCQNLQYLLYPLFSLWRDAYRLWNYTAHSHFSVYSNKAS